MRLVQSLIILSTVCLTALGNDLEQASDQSPKIISDYGVWRCFPTLLVTASEADKRIKIQHFDNYGSSIQTARDWTTGEGWFVFVQSSEKIWIYNGKHLGLLVIIPYLGSKIHWCDFPEAVPTFIQGKIKNVK